MKQDKVYIYGKHALLEALLHHPEVIEKVFLAPGLEDGDVRRLLSQHRIPVAELKEKVTSKLGDRDASHQGVIGLIDVTKLVVPFETFLQTLDADAHPALVLLDELQDPHNVGAIIRSAAAFGASGVLMPEHNQAPVTGAVVKTSAGMAFRIPLVKIGNVNDTIKKLKDKGFWVYGLAMEGSNEVGKETFDRASLFIIGNEGEGIRPKTLENCDFTVRIPMHSRTESLNAAVSAALVLYEWSKQHPQALQ
jgi:23S rRNA (guanosine2251-2'-O)-methyltransferase